MAKKQNAKRKKKAVNSHDAFFKTTFSYPDVVRSYIENFMDKNLTKNIDLDSLVLETTSYITPDLEEYFSDLVWLANYKGTTIKISLLFEHKSYVVQYPHVQLLRYLLEHFEAQIKAKEKLSIVIPIIIYHGNDEWKVRPFSDYFEGADEFLKAFIPNFNYHLTSLSNYSDQELIAMDIGKLLNVFLAMMHIRDINYIRENFATLFTYAEIYLKNPQNNHFLQTIFVYLFKNTDIQGDELENIITSVHENIKDFTMSTYDRLINEGLIKGRQEGIDLGIEKGIDIGVVKGIDIGVVKGRHEVVTSILTKFPEWEDEKIADLVNISVEVVAQIRKDFIIS